MSIDLDCALVRFGPDKTKNATYMPYTVLTQGGLKEADGGRMTF